MMRRLKKWGEVIYPYWNRSRVSGKRRRLSGVEALERRDFLSADLSVAMTAPSSALSGDVLAYDITVTNHGPEAVQNFSLTDALPANLTFVAVNKLSSTGDLAFSTPPAGYGGSITVSNQSVGPKLASGASFEIELVVRIATGLSDNATVTNSVQAASDIPDPSQADNVASISTTVHPPAVLIDGHVFFDANADGVRQPSELSAQEPSVFVDLNNNGVVDQGEPVSQLDSSGNYQFALAVPGVYTIREVPGPSDGLIRTAPKDGVYTVTASAGGTFNGLDFGETRTCNTVPVVPVANRFAPAADANAAFVNGLYRNVLERDPDAAGLAHWSAALSAGATRAAVANAIWSSLEHRGLEVNHFYETYLHRSADAAGRSYWAAVLEQSADENAVIAAIVGGAEYRAAHQSDQQFVAALYADILMRPTDPEGVAHWETVLQQGASRNVVAESVLHSPGASGRVADVLYAGYLHRGVNASGRQYIVDGLTNGSHLAGQYAVAVLASDEYFAQASAAAST